MLDLLPAGSAEAARARRWLRRPAAAPEPGDPGTPAEQTVLNATPAADITLERGRPPGRTQPVGSHHLLLAALADPDTAAARALAALGVDLEQAQGRAPPRGHHRHQRRAARRSAAAARWSST